MTLMPGGGNAGPAAVVPALAGLAAPLGLVALAFLRVRGFPLVWLGYGLLSTPGHACHERRDPRVDHGRVGWRGGALADRSAVGRRGAAADGHGGYLCARAARA
ncbi:hypothetical protein [Arthrobacter methylotrophus]|uniref:hypothetical protein n=1 Tax=Arthrobacter methylotrophus TaxID=121291 RepID=UPI0031EFFEC4